MKKRESFTTFEAAVLCHVTHHSIKNWIRQGLIKALRTPGGHYRILKRELDDFLRRYNMVDEVVAPTAEPEGGYTVLVVDDDKKTLKKIRDILEKNKYKTAEADNCFEAGMHAIKESPGLIILDFIMPRVDGFDICQSLRKNPNTRKIKILALTSLSDKSHIERMQACGIDDHLAKPFKSAELLERVDALLRGKKAVSGTPA